jgi:hypothetical protein
MFAGKDVSLPLDESDAMTILPTPVWQMSTEEHILM